MAGWDWLRFLRIGLEVNVGVNKGSSFLIIKPTCESLQASGPMLYSGASDGKPSWSVVLRVYAGRVPW